jgi:hypothetical protein
MKNSIFYLLVLMLCFASCKQTNEEKVVNENESTEIAAINKVVTDQTTSNPCTDPWDGSNCYCSLEIFPEAAFVWQSSWISYYNYDLNTRKLRDKGLYSNSPQTYFDSETMIKLHREIKDEANAGVLISYITTDNASIDTPPGLAIQNIVDCAVVPGGEIIFVPSGTKLGEEYSTDQGQLDKMTANWLSQNEKNDNVYSIAEGYIYSWEALMNNGRNKNATDIGISANFGLRTLEPGEEDNFKKNPRTMTKAIGKTGSVVYVNVLYFGIEEQNPDGTFSTMLNFAKPCPIYCGDY